ncbi:DUF1801 domain-containing protein [Sphingomonas sp. M1-B02]|uniref:DUF1801 domain-containing protein n=1 Tax=Sphingomonas sp. M1-B02 TaxID=3114300 RepID=UPI00223F3C24|nr:DUF1801 domain-containing protein [Sphingomonas sp. S6-11]UZK65629.1 DUF1801 domain-containing protein [Sphingomonas sp. S6-11]
MAETKTKPTGLSPATFIDAVEDPVRREDAKAVCAMMERISGEQAAMWGPSIIGFGSYHYRYESGHEGDMARISFSPRKAELVLYITGGFPRHAELMARLGKHRTGKSCLYIKRLSDVDRDILEELIRESLAWMDATYPR